MSFLKYYQGANPGKKRKNANPSEEEKKLQQQKYEERRPDRKFLDKSSSSFGIQLSIHWMITSCCACVGIRNNNKFSQFITYLQVVPTETNFVVKTIYNFIFI